MANRLIVNEITSIGLVDDGDNPAAHVTLYKRKFPSEQRERLAERGQALPDGSFPIVTVADLRNAISLFGRAANQPVAKRHIIKRARALNRVDLLPETWNVSKSAESVATEKGLMDRPETPEGLSDDVIEFIEKSFDAYAAIIDNLKEQIAELTPEPDPVDEAPDEVKAEFDKRDTRIAELEKALETERDKRLAVYYTDIAKGIDSDAEKLREIGEAVSDDTFEWLTDQLDGYVSKLKAADLFKIRGEGDDGDPMTKVESLAKEKQKQNSDLTIEQAKVLVRNENPELKQAERELARA